MQDFLKEFGALFSQLKNVDSFSAVPHTWTNTCMGLGSVCGRAMTPGWIVTVVYGAYTDVYHVSKYGGSKLAATT